MSCRRLWQCLSQAFVPSPPRPKGRKRRTRRDAKRLGRNGNLIMRDDGGTLRFYPAGAAQSYAPALGNVDHSATTSEPIDGIYKGVMEPSASRALVVAQPADSRLDAALRQHARAKALALRTPQGRQMAGQIVTTWDHMFVADPTGDLQYRRWWNKVHQYRSAQGT